MKLKYQALRLFLAFWCVMLLTALGGLGITHWLHHNQVDDLTDLDPNHLIAQARDIAQQQGTAGLQTWRITQEAEHPTLAIFLADAQGQDLDARTLPPRVLDWLLSSQRHVAHQNRQAVDTRQLGWWQVTPLPLAETETPRFLLFLPYEGTYLEQLARIPGVILALALGLSGLLCWLLAYWLSRPVRELQQATRALAAGQFQAPLPTRLLHRRDELGVLAQDIERLAQRVRELLAGKEALLRNVAHELRAPLTRLTLALEMAQARDARQPLQLERIGREAQRLDQLIGELLELARWRDQPGQYAAPVALDALIQLVLHDNQPEAERQSVQLVAELPTIAASASGDAEALRRLLDNLVRNAIAFSPAGTTVRVCLQPDHDATQTPRWQLQVIDQGPGVTPEALPHLFKPFYQATPRHPERVGSGLGLAIAASIAQHHGGSLTASLREDAPSGLCVTLSLPATPSAG